MSAAVLLLDPKYPHNIGNAVRACAVFGVPQLRWIGTRVDEQIEHRLPPWLCHDWELDHAA